MVRLSILYLVRIGSPDGVVIVGELNEVYPIRVLGDGRPEGTNTVVSL